MDKSVPTKVITRTSKWQSFNYTPSFAYCPNCNKILGGSHKQTECRHCGQQITWA